MSTNLFTFAPHLQKCVRDLAQLVAHTSGGREVAGSSPVIPTETKMIGSYCRLSSFFFISETAPHRYQHTEEHQGGEQSTAELQRNLVW